MKEIIKIIKDKKIEDSLIVMTNCSIHITKKLKEIYKDNKLKVIAIGHIQTIIMVSNFF